MRFVLDAVTRGATRFPRRLPDLDRRPRRKEEIERALDAAGIPGVILTWLTESRIWAFSGGPNDETIDWYTSVTDVVALDRLTIGEWIALYREMRVRAACYRATYG